MSAPSPAIAAITTVPTTMTPPTEETISYGEKLVENLAGISTKIATAANLKAEQKKARKTLGAINYHHERLKNLDQFPAARDLVCLVRDSKNDEVESLKTELNAHSESQAKLAKQVAGLFNDAETRGQKQPSGDLKAIEAEANSTRLSIEKITKDVVFLKNENTIQTKENHLLQKQVKEQANELQRFRRGRHEDVDYLRKVYDRGIGQASSEIRELREDFEKPSNHPISPSDLKRVEQLESDTSQLKMALAEIVNAVVTGQLKQVETAPKPTHTVDEDAVKALTQRLSAIETILSQKSNNTDQRPMKMDTESPDSKYDHLQKILQELIDLQAFKDDQQMKAIEDNDVKMGQKLQETVVKISADIKSQIETAMQQAKDDQVLKQLDKMAGLKESSELNDQRLQTLETAITSLESRYNSLSPNSLVDQAMPVFARLYPPPHVMQSVIDGLHSVQVHLSKFPDLSSLSTATESHGKQLVIMNSTVSRTTEDMRKRNTEAIAEMRNYKQQVQQDIADFQKGITGLNEMRDSFLSFVGDRQHNHDGTQKTLQDIIQERGQVEGEVSAVKDHVNEIHTQTQELRATLDQLKELQTQIPDLVANKDQLKELQAGVQDLDHRITRFSTILDSYRPEDMRLRLVNIEDSLKEQNEVVAHQLEGIQDKQKAVDQEISSLPHTSLEQFKQEIENIKNQLKQDSEDSGQPNGPYQTAILKMSKDVQKLAKKVRQLEQARTAIESQINAQSSDPDSLEARITPPAHATQENLTNRAKKRKRNQSSLNTNSPRWT
jgi:DNA repair exonuclease SbcCD ATPase subunit